MEKLSGKKDRNFHSATEGVDCKSKDTLDKILPWPLAEPREIKRCAKSVLYDIAIWPENHAMEKLIYYSEDLDLNFTTAFS